MRDSTNYGTLRLPNDDAGDVITTNWLSHIGTYTVLNVAVLEKKATYFTSSCHVIVN